MDYIILKYKEIIAIVGSLTGLISLGIILYSKYRDSNIKDKELALKEERFNLEKKHQISKEKYQKLFEQKIDVYKKLYSKVNKFKQDLYDVGRYFENINEYNEFSMDQFTIEGISITALESIFKEIEDNHFVISNEIMDSYHSIYKLYRESKEELIFLLGVEALDNKEANEKWVVIKNKFYGDYKNKIDNFFNQIDLEVKEIKQVLKV